MNRREFLHPRSLGEVAGPVLPISENAVPTGEAPTMLRFARRAMATTFEVVVPFSTPNAHEVALTALDEIDRLEAQLTVYRDSSEVSRLNAIAGDHPVRVEQTVFELLALAKKICAETAGAFDVSVGALIKAWGFFCRAGRVPTSEERGAIRELIGMQHVILDAQRQTVSYARQGLEINLGSIGKGFALDCAGQLANTKSILIHGGHSSVLARGDDWNVGVTDPRQPQRRRALVRLRNRGMATSAATYQHFEHEGKKLGHLLDPRTAWPAGGMLSATVTAPTAAEADALATAFFILGVDKARGYCERHPEVGAVLISTDAPERLEAIGYARGEVTVYDKSLARPRTV